MAACLLLAIALAPGLNVQATPQDAEEALDQVVADEWMPVPAFVVQEVPIPNGSWKRNAGWAHHDLAVEHRVVDGRLEITLYESASDGLRFLAEQGGSAGAPLRLRLVRGTDGRVSVLVSGSVRSCVSSGSFFDLHGELRLERRTAGDSRPLRFAFRIDAIDDKSLRPLRTEGAVELALAPGEWEVEIDQPVYSEPDPSPPMTALRESWWRWPDGKLRARGHVDAFGRRHGLWVTWTESSSFQSTTEFMTGERHGVWKVTSEGGDFVAKGWIEHGQQEGEWLETFASDLEHETFRVIHRSGVEMSRESLGPRSVEPRAPREPK